MASPLIVRNLGRGISYADGMAEMRRAIERVQDDDSAPCELLLLEHSDVITITRQHGTKHLLLSEAEIQQKNIAICETDRGGDVTFHGRGQLVGYPIIRIKIHDVMRYVRSLEQALIAACRRMGAEGCTTICGKTGVWLGVPHAPRKLAAIGVGASRNITRHGFALNITTDLERFTSCIVPCGLSNMGVTSLEREIKSPPDWNTVCEIVSQELKSLA